MLACYACMHDDILCMHACWHVGMLCQHEGILSMHMVCPMRHVRNFVHVKLDTNHPPTLNLCCIILIIKICPVHFIWCWTNTCFGYHYTYCRTHMPISGLQGSFNTWWKHEEPSWCVHGKGCCIHSIPRPAYQDISSLAAQHPYSMILPRAWQSSLCPTVHR